MIFVEGTWQRQRPNLTIAAAHHGLEGGEDNTDRPQCYHEAMGDNIHHTTKKNQSKNQAGELGRQYFWHSATPTAIFDHGGRPSWHLKEGKPMRNGPDNHHQLEDNQQYDNTESNITNLVTPRDPCDDLIITNQYEGLYVIYFNIMPSNKCVNMQIYKKYSSVNTE